MKADILPFRDNALKAARRVHSVFIEHIMEPDAVVSVEEFDKLANDVELMNAGACMLKPHEYAEMRLIIQNMPYVSITCRKG